MIPRVSLRGPAGFRAGRVPPPDTAGASLVVGVFVMKPRLSFALFVLWLAGGTAAMAQVPGSARPVFTRQALTALAHVTATIAAPQDPRYDWSRLRQLTNIDIVLFAQGLAGRRCRIVAVEDAVLTVVDLESPNRATLRIPRTDVSEIRQWTGRRRSRLGPVLGAAGGFALGFAAAIALADKQCGGSCADEEFSSARPLSECQSPAASWGIGSPAAIARSRRSTSNRSGPCSGARTNQRPVLSARRNALNARAAIGRLSERARP